MSASLPISLLNMFKDYLKTRKIKGSLIIIIIIIQGGSNMTGLICM